MKKTLQKAIKHFGTQKALANVCGLKQQSINYWVNHLGHVPAEYVLKIEKASDGKITRYELRPDLYPRD